MSRHGNVTIRFTKEELEQIKDLSVTSESEDVTSYCRNIIRRELKEQEVQSEDGKSGTQPIMIVETNAINANSGMRQNIPVVWTRRDKITRSSDRENPGYLVGLDSLPGAKDQDADWFTSYLAKLNRDCDRMQSMVDKLASDLDYVQAVNYRTAAETLKPVQDYCNNIHTLIDERRESLRFSIEETERKTETMTTEAQRKWEMIVSGGI